jgi:antitoxin component YwqK of YwqJK toxin-antitoxin module
MKLKSLFIYAIILIAMACKDEKPQAIVIKAHSIPNQYLALEDSSIIWHQDSLYFQGKPYSGKAYSLFANGDTAIYKEFWNGLQEGITKRWHPNKQMSEDRFYIAGKKEGKHRAWWPDGKPQFEFHVHEDAYEGELKEWNSKGLLIRQFHYQNGQEVGSQRLWWDDSTVRANYEIRDGKKYGLIGIKLCKNPYDSVK